MKKSKLAVWAHIAEIIAGVAVVISLAFIIFSIRQNTAVIRAAADADMYEYIDAWQSELLSNPDLRSAWIKYRNGESLTEEEDYLDFWQILRAVNQTETMFYRHREGLMSRDAWEKWDYGFAVLLTGMVPRDYWQAYLSVDKQEDFINYVDAIYQSQQP